MGEAYGAGQALHSAVRKAFPTVADAALNTLIPGRPFAQAAAPTLHDFVAGVINGPQGSVTTQLPAPRQKQTVSDASMDAAKSLNAAAANKSAGGAQGPQGSPSFDQILQAYAGANGGKISLRAMSALADIAAKTTAPHHVPTIADIAGQRALELGDQFATQKMNDAIKSGNKDAYAAAAQDQLDRYERIARARAIDPLTAAALEGN